jgi:Fur family transcriptional regulator, peroxide stress response regulator
MIDPELRYQTILAKIQEKGSRLTSHRIALLRLISVSEGHPSALELYEKLRVQFPSISLATIYKTLALLKDKGEVLEIDLPNENRYDGNKPFPHPHLICSQCKRIMDGGDVPAMQAINQQIADKYGFQVQSQQLIFYGICSDCQPTAG